MLTLHPHASENIRHFGKHLLATFLGLLMALALEQWREHRQEARTAEESLRRIEEELRWDRNETARRLADIEAERPLMEAYCNELERTLGARGEKHPVSLPPRPEVNNPDFSFTWSAWESARSTGILRQIDPARLQRLSEVYSDMQRLIPVQDRVLTVPAISDLITFAHRDPKTLTYEELRRLLNGYRFQQVWNTDRIRIGHEALHELDEALKP